MANTGLLAVWMDVAPEFEPELNRWYEEEHLKERLDVPGFVSTQRYSSLDGEPKFVALYEVTDPGVLQSEAYRNVSANPTQLTRTVLSNLKKSVRNVYELVSVAGRSQEPAPFAFLVRLETDSPENDEEMVRWYEGDHLPALTSLEGVTRARLYKAVTGSPKFLAVYELTSPEWQGGPAWRAATDTEWTQRMRPLFRNRSNNLAQLISTRP